MPGTPLKIGIHLVMQPGWHVYWKNPGDSGLPVSIQWALPEGFTAGEPQWPYPERLEVPPLMTYIFERDFFLPVTITPGQNLQDGADVPVKARLDWLVCAKECIPGHADVAVTLTAKRTPSAKTPLWNRYWAEIEPKLPVERSDWSITAHMEQSSIVLSLVHPARKTLTDVYFFAHADNVVNHAAPQTLMRTADGYRLTIPRSTLNGPADKIQGVVTAKESWDEAKHTGLAIDVPMSQQPAPLPIGPPPSSLSLALVLGFAFLGGLLLNLMPCVLPVISLKILNFIKHSADDRSRLRMHGIVFSAGIIAAFWVLTALLLFLQAAGHQVGWGFQFQSPWFLGFLAALFFVFALNLFGVFEFAAPGIAVPRAGGLSHSWASVFLNGVVATIAATPCSGPFMGTALGYSLSQPPAVTFAIFTMLALGLCFPYLVISMFPSLKNALPKPGPWMITFKRIMGLGMLASCLWILWVLMVRLEQPAHAAPSNPQHQETSSGIRWQPFSTDAVNAARKNSIVFIDFTARWCLSCKVNEFVALKNPAVVKKFEELAVTPFLADWTLKDDRITQALASYGKNSIPLYVLYAPGSDQPVFLPELLTPAIVIKALDNIKGN